MKILIFFLFTLVSLSSFGQSFRYNSCQEFAYQEVERLRNNPRASLLLESEIVYLEDNLYYNCKFGLSSLDSWICVDKSVSSIVSTSNSALHFNSRMKAWYETKRAGEFSPELKMYSKIESSFSVGKRFNHFKLDFGYKIMVEDLEDKDRLTGVKIDNRTSFHRKFSNISCLSVESILRD